MSADDDPEGPTPWLLISVLFSSIPLSPPLARLLLETAYGLYRRDEGVGELKGALVQGRVENLRKQWLMGVIGGPAFEASIDTERGSGTVRFVLTKQGIEHMAEREPAREMN